MGKLLQWINVFFRRKRNSDDRCISINGSEQHEAKNTGNWPGKGCTTV